MEQDVNATPAAKKKAEEMGLDLAKVTGTGVDGRITVEDVETAYEREQERRKTESGAASSEDVRTGKVRTKAPESVTAEESAAISQAGASRSSLLARRKAQAHGISIDDVAGAGYASGPDGSVQASDVESYAREEGVSDSPVNPSASAYVRLLAQNVPGTGYSATYYDEDKRGHTATVSKRNAQAFTEREIDTILQVGKERYGLTDADFQIVEISQDNPSAARPASSADIRQRRTSGTIAAPAAAVPVLNQPATLPGSGAGERVAPETGPGSPGTEVPTAGSATEERQPAAEGSDEMVQ